MSSNVWRASAPANIALIKYMGKAEGAGNFATNSSLSYTLSHLQSYVELAEASEDSWRPLEISSLRHFPEIVSPAFEVPELSRSGQTRFLKHLQFLKDHFEYKGHFLVRSANGFPSDCGLASSASSFAALTKCAVLALSELTGKPQPNVIQLAELSMFGSGSSCRSLFSPWSVWTAEGPSVIDLPYKDLLHQVIVVDSDQKKVSSSEAHKRVRTSLLFEKRGVRVEERMRELVAHLKASNWGSAYETTWAEFWDMHALFETAKPAFGYLSAASLHVLRFVQESTWWKSGDGPIVTMDAGPNVHLLYRADQREMAEVLQKEFAPMMRVFSSYDLRAHFAGGVKQ